MNRICSWALILVVCASAQAAVSAQAGAQTGKGEASLYKRLGGYDAIAAVTDDFVPRLATDKQLGHFFQGHSADTLKKIRQLAVDLICSATGGPCVYIGRDMKTAHGGLGISAADWNIAVGHLKATLDKFKVGKKEQDDFLAVVTGLRKDIVEKP